TGAWEPPARSDRSEEAILVELGRLGAGVFCRFLPSATGALLGGASTQLGPTGSVQWMLRHYGKMSRRQQGSLHPQVERIAQAVTEEVEAKHGHEDREAGKEGQPGVLVNESDVGLEIPSPARRRRLGAEPEER